VRLPPIALAGIVTVVVLGVALLVSVLIGPTGEPCPTSSSSSSTATATPVACASPTTTP
jgi:hypothetical protein